MHRSSLAQDWEDNVDTKVYMKLLKGLRKAFDAATPRKKYLITVAPGWPRYPWDASANGVVDAFDMMSYSNSLEDLSSAHLATALACCMKLQANVEV